MASHPLERIHLLLSSDPKAGLTEHHLSPQEIYSTKHLNTPQTYKCLSTLEEASRGSLHNQIPLGLTFPVFFLAY